MHLLLSGGGITHQNPVKQQCMHGLSQSDTQARYWSVSTGQKDCQEEVDISTILTLLSEMEEHKGP